METTEDAENTEKDGLSQQRHKEHKESKTVSNRWSVRLRIRSVLDFLCVLCDLCALCVERFLCVLCVFVVQKNRWCLRLAFAPKAPQAGTQWETLCDDLAVASPSGIVDVAGIGNVHSCHVAGFRIQNSDLIPPGIGRLDVDQNATVGVHGVGRKRVREAIFAAVKGNRRLWSAGKGHAN